MGLLNLLPFWSHTWGIPSWLWVQRQPAEHPLKKGSSVLCKHIVFQESTKFLGFLACVFCLFTPMLLTGLTCLRAQCFTAVFWGGKQWTKCWRMHSEPLQAATRLCCSLLGNAGRALARAGFASLLWTDNLVQSISKHRCQLQAHVKGCWCKSAPRACLSSLTSQPSPPHLGASFLHDALLHLQPLPCQLINSLISQQPPGQTAEQLQMRGTSLRSVCG